MRSRGRRQAGGKSPAGHPAASPARQRRNLDIGRQYVPVVLSSHFTAALLVIVFGFTPDPIPDFELNDLDGRLRSYTELAGEQLTVIDFWATWCGPCIRSIPKLVLLHEELKGEGIHFIGINVDSPRNLSKVKPFAGSLGITYPVLLDVNADVMGRLNVTAVPTLLVVDRDREVVLLHEGYQPGDAEALRDELLDLLEQVRARE